jgi:diguanylate cyclase (GGDEF)-like protein
MTKFKRRLVSGLLLLGLLVVFTLSVYHSALANGATNQSTEDKETEDRKTQDKEITDNIVRVGYVISGNFQAEDENGRKSGYGYEYLQKIAYFTGWKYEYIYGSFKELLEMLENGEIDIMSDISYTDERAQLIDYSTMEQGQEYYYIYTYKDDNSIISNNLELLNGKKIGINAGSYQIQLFNDWCWKNNINCELVEYENSDEREADVANGAISAMVTTGEDPGDDFVPIAMIGRGSYYIGVSKSRPDILESVNEAMAEIQSIDPYYNERLSQKYSTSSMVVKRALTDEEIEFLHQYGDITIGYLVDYMPYCSVDRETGNLDGFLGDMIEYFCDTYGLEIKTECFDSYLDMMEALYNGSIDISFPNIGDYGIAEDTDEMISESLLSTTMVALTGSTKLKDSYKIGISMSDPFQSQYALIYYTDDSYSFNYYDSIVDCINAVENGNVDFTFVESAKINEIEYALENKKIQKIDLREAIDVSFAVNHGNIQLLAILNKCILAVDDSRIFNSLIANSQQYNPYTAKDFIEDHIVALFTVVIIVFGTIIVILVSHFISMKKSKKKITEAYNQITSARWEAGHDTLTGLLNRAGYQNIGDELKNSNQPIALLVIDVDRFKEINDTYGHKVGDKALMRVATTLMQGFRSEDYVIRYAGDEFVVIMTNFSIMGKHVIAAKVDGINTLLQNPTEDTPKLSISVGIAFSDKGFDESLFVKADKALYSTKKNGRCGYSFY